MCHLRLVYCKHQALLERNNSSGSQYSLRKLSSKLIPRKFDFTACVDEGEEGTVIGIGSAAMTRRGRIKRVKRTTGFNIAIVEGNDRERTKKECVVKGSKNEEPVYTAQGSYVFGYSEGNGEPGHLSFVHTYLQTIPGVFVIDSDPKTAS